MSAWEIMLPAFAVCALLIATHTYFGLHVLARGIIFVDIALAQVAVFGTSVAFALGHDAHSAAAHGFAFGAAALAALAFAALRRIADKTTREAAIGVVSVVATAASLAILANSPAGVEELKTMLSGNLLAARWRDVRVLAFVVAAVGALHWRFYPRFYALSFAQGDPRPHFWAEAAFFISFAAVITFAREFAGVLLVFAYLVVPAFSASLLTTCFLCRWGSGAALALVASAAGLWLSYAYDLSIGATIVTVLGVLPLAAAVLAVVRRT